MESPNNFLGRAARVASRMASRRRNKRSLGQNEMLSNFRSLGGVGGIGGFFRSASGKNLAAGAANAAQVINTSQTEGANLAQTMANQVNNTITPQASSVIDPASLDPTGGAALMPPANQAANVIDPISANQVAVDMFGTPLTRQRSMSNKYIKK